MISVVIVVIIIIKVIGNGNTFVCLELKNSFVYICVNFSTNNNNFGYIL